jgi:hypothetical protein
MGYACRGVRARVCVHGCACTGVRAWGVGAWGVRAWVCVQRCACMGCASMRVRAGVCARRGAWRVLHGRDVRFGRAQRGPRRVERWAVDERLGGSVERVVAFGVFALATQPVLFHLRGGTRGAGWLSRTSTTTNLLAPGLALGLALALALGIALGLALGLAAPLTASSLVRISRGSSASLSPIIRRSSRKTWDASREGCRREGVGGGLSGEQEWREGEGDWVGCWVGSRRGEQAWGTGWAAGWEKAWGAGWAAERGTGWAPCGRR